MTPLRQFRGVPQEVIRKAEGKQFVSFSFNKIILLPLSAVLLALGSIFRPYSP